MLRWGSCPVVDVLPFWHKSTVLKAQTDKIYHWPVLSTNLHLLNGRDVILFHLRCRWSFAFFSFLLNCTGLYEICINSPRTKRNQWLPTRLSGIDRQKIVKGLRLRLCEYRLVINSPSATNYQVGKLIKMFRRWSFSQRSRAVEFPNPAARYSIPKIAGNSIFKVLVFIISREPRNRTFL